MSDERGLRVFDAPNVRVLSEEVTLAIEKAIFLGAVTPGQRLVESEIARQMGVSKAPVREALRNLETLGLVVSSPRRGTFVTSLSATLASEAFSFRTLIECYAVRLAVPKLVDGHLRAMAELDRASDASSDDYPMQIEYDLRVHDLLPQRPRDALAQDRHPGPRPSDSRAGGARRRWRRGRLDRTSGRGRASPPGEACARRHHPVREEGGVREAARADRAGDPVAARVEADRAPQSSPSIAP